MEQALFKNKRTPKNVVINIEMTTKILIFSLAFIFILGLASAQIETLGTFKQNSCVILKQTCGNCTYGNVTSVLNPQSIDILGGSKAMTQSGIEYTYDCINVTTIGKHIVNGVSDVDGINTVWAYDFEVTPSGFANTLGFTFIILIVCGLLVLLGFAIKDGWFVVFGGMGLISFGLYSFINGIAGFKDTLVTYGTSLFFIGVGAYLAINSALQIIDE